MQLSHLDSHPAIKKLIRDFFNQEEVQKAIQILDISRLYRLAFDYASDINSDFPINSIAYVLTKAGINFLEELDAIPIYCFGGLIFERSDNPLIIPSNIKTIRSLAFNDTKIYTIALPKSITWVAPDAFEDCTTLIRLTYPGTREDFLDIDHIKEALKGLDITIKCSDGNLFSKYFKN